MTANSALFILCRSGYHLTSMCVVMLVLGLTTPDPKEGLPFPCEPSELTKSRGIHFRLWGLVCSIVVDVCGYTGAGMSE